MSLEESLSAVCPRVPDGAPQFREGEDVCPGGKYEPNMRTRFEGQLMSILSISLQGDTTERITAWESEIAT